MKRIVIIEDEPVLRLTFHHILEEEGFEVHSAENGKRGVELCRAHRPDLVITDVVMPELSGSEALNILQSEFPRLPIIAMSGMEGALAEETGPDEEGVCFVMKPIEPAAMIRLVWSMTASSSPSS